MIGAASLPSYMLKTAMARWIVRTMYARVHANPLDGAGQVGKWMMLCTVLWGVTCARSASAIACIASAW